MAAGEQVVVTTEEFRRGQRVVRQAARLHCAPNWKRIDSIGGEFAAGARYERDEHIAPMLLVDPDWTPPLVQPRKDGVHRHWGLWDVDEDTWHQGSYDDAVYAAGVPFWRSPEAALRAYGA